MSGQKKDGIKLLTDLSGLDRAKVIDIWEEVKKNQMKLRSCSFPHALVEGALAEDEKLARKRWVCSKCGGWMTREIGAAYNLGLEHQKLVQ